MFIFYHKTREIVEFVVTRNLIREFVKQQSLELEDLKELIISHPNKSLLKIRIFRQIVCVDTW